MIDRDHALPITRQASLLGMSRGSVYYLPRATSEADLELMRRIDELHLEHLPHQSHDGPNAGHGLLQRAASDAGCGRMG